MEFVNTCYAFRSIEVNQFLLNHENVFIIDGATCPLSSLVAVGLCDGRLSSFEVCKRNTVEYGEVHISSIDAGLAVKL